MSTKRKDISQIEKYLKGQLDTKAMHQLEHEAQDDPFLMEALEGYETSAHNIQADLDNLHQRLTGRIADRKQHKLFWWRVIPIAASLLMMVGAGWWMISNKSEKLELNKTALNHTSKKFNHPATEAVPTPVQIEAAESAKDQKTKSGSAKASNTNSLIAGIAAPKPASNTGIITYKEDTVQYKVAQNVSTAKLEDILKKMPGMDVDANGRLIAKNTLREVTVARLNGKEFAGGSVQQAVKNLPADIIEKIQVVDDYGDQAKKKRKDSLPSHVADNPIGTVEELLQGRGEGLILENRSGAFVKAASYNVTGKVTNDYGVPLKGISIFGAHTLLAKTDANGAFSVIVPADSLLSVVSANYFTKSVKIYKPNDYSVILTPQQPRLAEVTIPRLPSASQSYQKKLSQRLTTSPTYIAPPCQENLAFKTKYFESIAIADRYVFEHAGGYVSTIKDNAFLRALKFIGKYVPNSIEPDSKAVGYNDLKAFAEYKKHWLDWYQTHKCDIKY